VATVGWPATCPRLATHDRWQLDLGGHAARIGCGNELPAAGEPPEPRSRSSSWPYNGPAATRWPWVRRSAWLAR
jgi:hypothetical protein